MSSPREAILAAIRSACEDVPSGESPAWSPDREPSPVGEFDLVERFAERLADYGAGVAHSSELTVGEVIAAILERHGATRLAVPADLPDAWRRGIPTVVTDRPTLSNEGLDAVDGAVTGAACAIAETGTILLDCGRAQGRRALTLVPDLHVCVVNGADLVADVPEAIARSAGCRRPVTFVSGPSATSDIELERVSGVHGPRSLEVVIVQAAEKTRTVDPTSPDD